MHQRVLKPQALYPALQIPADYVSQLVLGVAEPLFVTSNSPKMKKLGFGKKSDDGEDSSRSALFGRKKSSPAPQADNPYAQASDPYADTAKYANMSPYQQARSNLNNGPRAPPGGAPAGPGGPGGGRYGSPSPASGGGGYGAPPPASGYGSDRYGSGTGYGSNRYDNAPAAGARGPGGYGGFGQSGNNEPDSNRDALFSDAQQRHAQKQQTVGAGGAYGQPGSAANPSSGDYSGGYGESRELTAEEQEDAEYQAILQEKRRIQQESASSVSRSVQMARQANEVGRATLARLGAQGERLHNTEKNLDLAANQNKVAQDRAAELKTLNRSMFAVHVGNPFTSKQRQLKADEAVLSRHREEREQRENTRREGFAATQRMESNFRDINGAGMPRQQARKKEYGKYNLDDEEGADELEDQIDDGLDELEGQVKMMNMVGKAIGKEVDVQNKRIDIIMGKFSQSDAVDDATRMNRERLARFK
ncbi:Protein transport protein SEC9 [Paramyrothecium foliicola]|nr:Protein transport protein SEC9 [Paramyrothecium foliicola]